jgi:hypothetical protein
VGLSNGAGRVDLRNLDKLRNLALRCGLSWYMYANVNQGRMARNDSLYLVTGCDKANSWGIASWHNEVDHSEISFTFTTSQLADGHFSYTYSREIYSPATVRVSPEPPANNENQCIFLRGFKITIRESVLAKMMRPFILLPPAGIQLNDTLPQSRGGYIPFRGSRQGRPPGGSTTRNSGSAADSSQNDLSVCGSGDANGFSADGIVVEMAYSAQQVKPLVVPCCHVINMFSAIPPIDCYQSVASRIS